MSRVIFTRKAQNELNDATAWYEKRNAALGQRFIDAARETAERTASNPLANRLVLGVIRWANFPKRAMGALLRRAA